MPQSGAIAGTRKARAAETEVALKEAAKRVFDRVGYLRAKITDITAEADRAAGSFYSHFDSKEQLLEALLVDMLEEGDRRAAMPDHNPDPMFRDMAAHLDHVRAAGGHLPGDPMTVAMAMISLMSQYARTWLLDYRPDLGPRPSGERAVDMLAAFILHGIMGVVTPSPPSG